MPTQPQSQPSFRSSNYALGILFLVAVSLLWTACSIVVQHLYRDMEFDSPFLIVYIGTSLFSVFLPSRLVYERRKAVRDRCGRCSRCCCHCCCCRRRRRRRRRCEREGGENGGVDAANMEVEAAEVEVEEEEEEEAVVVIPWRHRDEATRPRTSLPLSGGSDWGLALASRSDDVDADDTTVLVDREGHHHNHAKSKQQPQQPQQPQPQQQHKHYPHYLLSHRDHISMASKVAPLWFLSNYFYAQSLRWTSIASSTVLASTGSLFAFGFATCSRFGDERLTKGKLLGVLLCFLGGVATAWTDVEQPQTQPQPQPEGAGDITDDDGDERSPFLALAGDAAGLLSAVGYGAYTVLIRHLCPTDEDRMSMQLLFGYIGLWNMVVLFPAALWVAWPDDHRGSHSSALTSSVFLFLLLKGLLDNVLSDYLWARAVILTSATVASVGVGLTIPMAFAADWIVMGNGREGGAGWGDGAGAVLVLLGFLFVNVNVFGEEDGDWNRRDDDDDDGDGDGDDDDDDEMEEMDFEMEDERNGKVGSAHDVGILT